MYLAVGEREELEGEGMGAVGPWRVPLGEQVAHWGEPAAVPGGSHVPVSADAVLFPQLGIAGENGDLRRVAVVAQQHLATLESPHLDGSALSRQRRLPKAGSLVGVGANGVGEVYCPLGTVSHVEVSHPHCLVARPLRHNLDELCQAEVMQLPQHVAVARQGVFNVIDEEIVKVHVLHLHLALPQLAVDANALHSRSRDKEFLERAAVEFVELIEPVHSSHVGIGRQLLPDVLGAVTPHDGLYHGLDEIVGDGRGGVGGIGLVLQNFCSSGSRCHVAPLVAVGEALVAKPPCPQCARTAPSHVGVMENRLVGIGVLHDNK